MTDNDDDPVTHLQLYTLELSDRIDDLLARVEALRRALEPLGLTQQKFDEHFFAVTEEIRAHKERELPKAVAQANDERLAKRLKSHKGPKH